MFSIKHTVLAKVESTYGEDSLPVATDAISVSDLSVTVEPEKLGKNPLGGSMSPVAHLIGQKWVNITFSVLARGSGAAGTPPETSPLKRACGMSETINAVTNVIYAPVSSGFESSTIYAYLDGAIHKITGCRGSFEVVCESGQYIKETYNLSGRYSVPVNGALLTGTYDSTASPVCSTVGLLMGAYGAIAQSLQVNLNNKIAKLKDLNSSGRIEITGREPSGSIDPEAVTEATKPFWANWAAGTREAISLTVGATAGNIIALSIPKACYESIAWADKEGIRKYEMPFTCTGNAGDDEIVITYT